MQTRAARLMAIIGLAAVGSFGADNSLGVWIRNVEQTKYANPDPNPITGVKMVREAAPGGLKVTSTGQRQDGTTINYTFTVKYDGKDYPVSGVGSVFDTIAITQIDANRFPSVTKKGKYFMKGMTTISKDGKTMTITNEGTDAQGKPQKFTVVWNKQ